MQGTVRNAMALKNVNYNHSFEEQHEAVIANVIKKVIHYRHG